MQNLRDKLIAVLEQNDVKLDGESREDTPLIVSGNLDSLGLLKLALFIETEVGRNVNFSDFDLAKELNTIKDILNFIDRLRASDQQTVAPPPLAERAGR